MFLNTKNRKYDLRSAHRLTIMSSLVYKAPDYLDTVLPNPAEYFDMGGTQAFITPIEDTLIIAFRGTDEPGDWLDNINVGFTDEGVHKGFDAAFNDIWLPIERYVLDNHPGKHIFITGHSSGGALAALAAWRLDQWCLVNVWGVYTYGSPRVGNSKFMRSYNDALKSITYRHVNNNDIVPRMPSSLTGYRHVGQLKYYGYDGRPTFKMTLIDALRGLWAALFKRGLDCYQDHIIEEYKRVIQKESLLTEGYDGSCTIG